MLVLFFSFSCFSLCDFGVHFAAELIRRCHPRLPAFVVCSRLLNRLSVLFQPLDERFVVSCLMRSPRWFSAFFTDDNMD